jgi:hypothetical protein
MLTSEFHQARSANRRRAINVLIHLQRATYGLPRPELDGEAGAVGEAGERGGEGGNRGKPAPGTLLAASLLVSAIFVALTTAALFY